MRNFYSENSDRIRQQTMTPLQRMELNKPKFTPNDTLIYETISRNPDLVIHMTTSTLAEKCGVSQPALSRFVKSLGYNRYQDFRADVIAWQSVRSEQEAEGSSHLAYFNMFSQLMHEAEQVLTAETLKDLADYISGFDRLYASGVGKSYHPAELFEILSFKTQHPVHAIRRDMLIEAGDYITDQDLLIIFSVSAGSHIMTDAARTNSRLLLITANPNHGLEDYIDRCLVLPYIPPDPESSAVSPVLFDMLVEMLIPYLLPRK